MSIQVPKSIKPVASRLAYLVVQCRVQNLDDLPFEKRMEVALQCDHECWHQDANRYMEDVYREAVQDGRIPCDPW